MEKDPDIFNNLFIFEMANNHMGSVEHGIKIIREMRKVINGFDFNFGFKLQYRNMDTFVHPDFKARDDFRYIKRFQETRLGKDQLKRLKDEITDCGFVSVCAPFDEVSVDLIENHGFDIIKIGSCSFTDWPLLERIVRTDKPIVASTAGVSLDELDRVVSFLEHREKVFALMHCTAEYPTRSKNLQLNQIDLLKSKYPHIRVGYSTHASPEDMDSVKIAIAKGASVFERHVGFEADGFTLNAYSAGPAQVRRWLESARDALAMCGIADVRPAPTVEEKQNLTDLRRGVYAGRKIDKDEIINRSNVFFAMPVSEGQLTANDMSKYTDFYAQAPVDANGPVHFSNIRKVDNREKVYRIVQQVKGVLRKSRILVPKRLDLEISHHYGIDRFGEYGATLINFVNREYCKKLIILVPGQKHPEQYHEAKEETFHILCGDVLLNINGAEKRCKAGDLITIEKGARHIFGTKGGAVIEEISSTYDREDSHYTDPAIADNKHRKTLITYWMD